MTHKEAANILRGLTETLRQDKKATIFLPEIDALEHAVRVIEYRIHRNNKNGKKKR